MTRTPPSNVMVSPKSHGLTLVQVFFGTVRPEPRDLVVVSGDAVVDASGRLSYFVGMDANRRPVLADTPELCADARQLLDNARCHVETCFGAQG